MSTYFVHAVFVILLHGGGVFVSCRPRRRLSLSWARTGDGQGILVLSSSAYRGQPGLSSLLAVDYREPRNDVSGSRREPCIASVITEIKRARDDPARSYSTLDMGSNFMPPIVIAKTCNTHTSQRVDGLRYVAQISDLSRPCTSAADGARSLCSWQRHVGLMVWCAGHGPYAQPETPFQRRKRLPAVAHSLS